MSFSPPVPSAPEPTTEIANSGWPQVGRSVLIRAVLGLVLLFIIVAGGAWLMHAGIQAEAEPAAEELAVSKPAPQWR